MKKINKHKLFIFIITIITLVLLFFFLKNIIVEIIKLQIKNDTNGIKELLSDKGWFGYLSIILVEAMQMVVVFISAEFIQISAGISYPWYLAVPLCSCGIFLGSTIIYLLCTLTKFDSSIFKKSADKINEYTRKSNNVQLLMYILFVMPVIPFGAICYFGSNSKISYKRYIFTCLTGTIPSILTSIFLGKIISIAIIEEIPAYVVILSIIAAMILLLIAGIFILNKTVLKDHKNTPESPVYNILLKIFKLGADRKLKYTKDDFKAYNLEEPYILLTNHPSGYDVYFISDMVKPSRLVFILNYYYFRFKPLKFIFDKIGVIPKKLFTPDLKTIKGTIRATKAGYPIFMCPEGRLGLDGTNYYITKETGKFLKQLKLPIVICTISGAYISKPKWRKHRIKSNVHTKITRIISKEEVLSLSPEELNNIVNENIKYNEFDYIKENKLTFKEKNKAKGLENVLYYCPKCHQEHCLTTNNNTIKCEKCGFNLTLQKDYHFNDNEFNIKTIHDWYQLITNYELENIKRGINLSCEVEVKKFNIEKKKLCEKGKGICTLTNTHFKFEGDLNVKEFTIAMKDLRALAFSCGEEFECYFNDELYYFYPKTNKQQCTKWALIVDEIVKGEDINE